MTAPKVTFYDIAPELAMALVAKLAQAAWDKGKRLIIRCADMHQAMAVDENLWTFREESFIPHELHEEGSELLDKKARIVITTGDERPIDGDILLQLAPAELGFAATFAHVIDFVDHRDESRLAASRQRYRAWAESGGKPEVKNKV